MTANKLLNTILFFIVTILFISCEAAEKGMSAKEYANHITEWDSLRLHRLKAPDGWVNLAGLFWLNEGDNKIGSSGNNDIVFPRGPEEIGIMTLDDNKVWFHPNGGVGIKAEGEDIKDSIFIFREGSEAVLLTTDSLGFFIIRRGERIGIRLRDYVHPRLDKLNSIDRYPPDQNWIIKTRFIESDNELIIRVPDVLGEISEEIAPGLLEFEYEGETFRLFPTGSRDRLFVIFADDTNAQETYGGGRFLSGGEVDSDGYAYLDFNKAYNPPCAFSPFATCPLPPRENFLPFSITAGEKIVKY